jgi:hypothetical protein
MTIAEQMKQIVPGKTYPSAVKITETFKGKKMVVQFLLNSYFVGMYCAVHVNGMVASQTGDHNNKTCCAKIKKDITKALARGAKVEIEGIRECKLEMT